MHYSPKSIRPFIGSKDYQRSRDFYKTLGFEEKILGNEMCLFKVNEDLAFYLQDAYIADWVNNTMIVLEVEDLDVCMKEILSKDLPAQFSGVRFTGPKSYDWGRELFMHDPSGVLWHFCEFKG